jgi:sulfite oxidase
MPVQSAITSISQSADKLQLSGYAFGGAGRRIQRVDVSTDGGTTWQQAQLKPYKGKGSMNWSWTQWELTAPVAEASEICVKAVDCQYNQQVCGLTTLTSG